MKKTNAEELLKRNSVPILSWDFHYEFVNELKANFADLKKVNDISSQFSWNDEGLEIKEHIKDEVVVITDLNLKIVFA
ncbi:MULTISPECIES: hypothetical protein [unclassified Flavobacterium]|uniref:hypothetical protein n=1 Tax=unclassified Flavobacterium TaxID=196869 RepID=UPI001E307241|nr:MULTISPECIES: hypothetical protein [unclassified Flavobacterium]